MLEKRWKAVPPQVFIASGTASGQLKLVNTSLFKVKQLVFIASGSIPSAAIGELEVKRIDDKNTMYLGPVKGNIDARTDISAYTALDGAFIFANEQKRSSVPEQDVERNTYEEEPIVARRVIGVSRYGEIVDASMDGIVPQEFDDIILTRDLDGDITEAKFYLNGALIDDLDLTYDLNKDVIRVKKV